MARHPLDPEGPHRAAPLLGRLVATGLMARQEALDALLQAPADRRLARIGLDMRLTHALDDAARAHERQRARTERAVRRALTAPLAARQPREALLAAADAADPDGDLLPRERRALVREEVAWTLRAAFKARR
jgi:hypothetical protein